MVMIKKASKHARLTAVLLALVMTCSTAFISTASAESSLTAADTVFQFGSAGTELAPGEYEIGASLMNASNIANPSAAAECVKGASLTVSDSGEAVVTVDLGTVTFGSITGYARDWAVYTDWSAKTKVYAAVDEEAELADGITYPSKISFTLPDNSWDGVYVNMYVSAMGSSPDAYLALDYTEAGKDKEYEGSASVEAFGKYNVNVKVTVSGGRISAVDISGSDFSGTYAEDNKAYLKKAAKGMQDKWTGLAASQSNAKNIYNVDTVTGATYSSEAIRDAVMAALSLTWEPETINVPASVTPGVYSVDVSYYTDQVRHYLTEDKLSSGMLTVRGDGSIQLGLDLLSSMDTAQMCIMDIDGYYKNNSTSEGLTETGMTVLMQGCDYSDEYFAEGTQVVKSLSTPLTGGLSAEYVTSVYMYVPAMNNLDGEVSGIEFDHGRFHIDSNIKVYWDSLSKVRDLNDSEKSAQPLSVKAVNKKFKASKVRKKAQSFKVSEAVSVSGAKGGVAYKAAAANKKSKKALKIKNGKITVKKKTKKGTYKVKVTAAAAATSGYKAASKTVTVTIKVT